MTETIIKDRAIALSTCIELVKSGRLFVCERTDSGWRFVVHPG